MCKIQLKDDRCHLFITQNLPNQFPSFDCSSHHQERHLCHHHFFHCCVLFCMFDTVDVWDNSSCHMYLDQKIEGTTFIPGYNYIRIYMNVHVQSEISSQKMETKYNQTEECRKDRTHSQQTYHTSNFFHLSLNYPQDQF